MIDLMKRTQKEKESLKNNKEKNINKQKQKDAKKKYRKKKQNLTEGEGVCFGIPNIRNIPLNCKHLVKDNYVLYVVPGDGCCGPNCGAAFLFQDEVFGPKLRRNMNIFFADHWYEKYQYLTQCSPGHPFVRKVKGKGKFF